MLIVLIVRLSAPVFAAPIAHLFNKSLAAGIVPTRWKTAIISPIPKVANPQQPSDFRPISVTPVLSRMPERLVVRHPAIMHPPPGLCFTDQYAFRPTDSTTTAIIALLYTVRSMLTENHPSVGRRNEYW